MAELAVHALEMIHVDEHECHVSARALRAEADRSTQLTSSVLSRCAVRLGDREPPGLPVVAATMSGLAKW